MTFEEALQAGPVSTEAALALFDRLEPVDLQAMVGTWRGSEFPTGHPMDGLLAAAGWYGKQFLDAERVHPLLFWGAGRRDVFAIDPARVPVALPLMKLHHPAMHALLVGARPAIQTREPKARLRMVEFRGRTSATMIYDDRPIMDVFRRVDADTVLGLMDMRGLEPPYFFVLRRDGEVRFG